MQGTTKRVANIEDPSPETKAKVSGCESLHKQEKTAEKDTRIGTWLRTWCRFLDLNWLQVKLIEAKSAHAPSSEKYYRAACKAWPSLQ